MGKGNYSQINKAKVVKARQLKKIFRDKSNTPKSINYRTTRLSLIFGIRTLKNVFLGNICTTSQFRLIK